jgi:hypothetical protein
MINKKSKIFSNVSPGSSGSYNPLDYPTPLSASSKTSKLSKNDLNDLECISIFLESLNAWLNGYFFSKLSLENSQLPSVPKLDNTELCETCNSLRTSIAKIRENALLRISASEKKGKESYEKIKSSPHSKSRPFIFPDTLEEKKIQIIVENTIKESKKQGFTYESKTNLIEKCEEICYNLLTIGQDLQAARNKIIELENNTQYAKTRKFDESNILSKSKQDNEINLLQVVYPLIERVHSLQEKKQFYSLIYRHYEKFLLHEEQEIRKLLETKDKQKRKNKLKIIFICVLASIKIKNSKKPEEKIVIKGIKIKLLDPSVITSNKTITTKSLPGIISSIYKTLGFSNKERGTLNAVISSSLSTFQKFMNDIKAVLTILLKKNIEQKEVVAGLTQDLKDAEEERAELEGALTRTVEYTKNLEEEIMEMTGDPEYLKQIGEDTEISLELEAHKKALKGITSQYNQLEHKMDELNRKYEDLKKENSEKSKKLQQLEEIKEKNRDSKKLIG